MLLKSAGIFFIVIYSCGSISNKENKQKSTLRALRVTQNFPYIDSTGKLLGYDSSSVNIYYYEEQVLYSDFYRWNEYVQNVLTKTEIRQNYFVYTKGKNYGFFYDKYKAEFDKKILKDSMLEAQWYNQTNYSSALLMGKTSHYNIDSGTLTKSYFTKGRTDSSMNGTALLQFTNKLPWVDYSLVKEFDTVKEMKLCRINCITNSRYIKNYDITLDTIEQIFYMEEIPITNKEEILYYFDREKKYNKD